MLRSATRRLTAVSVLAAILVAGLIAISSATASAPRPHVVYRNFCPVDQSQVAAAGPYEPSR